MEKRILFLTIIVIIILTGCVSTGSSSGEEENLDRLKERWISSIINRDLELYSSCFWEDACKTEIFADGEKSVYQGLETILEDQGAFFKTDYQVGIEDFSDTEKYFQTETGLPQYVIKNSNSIVTDILQFEKRDGEWRILDYWIFIHYFFDPAVPTEFQKWADTNGNGILEFDEQSELFTAVEEIISEPGTVRNPAAEAFDRNRDGFLDDMDVMYARLSLVNYGLRRFQIYDKDFAYSYVSNGSQVQLNRHDVWFYEECYFYDRESFYPRELTEFYDHKMDFNMDGYINQGEIDEYRDLVVRMVSLLPQPEYLLNSGKATMDDIISWTDSDKNGKLTPFELGDLEYEVFLLFLFFDQDVFLPLHSYFDTNEDFLLDNEELEGIREYLLLNYVPKIFEDDPDFASSYLDINGSSQFEEDEAAKLIEHIQIMAPQGADYPVQTEFDLLSDLNENGLIEPEERDIIEFDFFRKLTKYWLMDSQYQFPDSSINYSVNNNEIQGRKVALIDVASSLPEIEKKTLDGMLTVIEDSLVNSSTLSVVERKNIDAVMTELNFQLNEIIDEKSAIEIGKMTGADTVALGTLKSLADQYLLQLKVIDVLTGEIIGSSIVSGDDETDFPEMCRQSVLKLF